MEQFSELFDQISAYENNPDTVHYVTRFVDGLKPAVRMLVALQQPEDLDAAYQLALLHESLVGSSNFGGHSNNARRSLYPVLALPAPARNTQNKQVEDRKPVTEGVKNLAGEDKWGALRA